MCRPRRAAELLVVPRRLPRQACRGSRELGTQVRRVSISCAGSWRRPKDLRGLGGDGVPVRPGGDVARLAEQLAGPRVPRARCRRRSAAGCDLAAVEHVEVLPGAPMGQRRTLPISWISSSTARSELGRSARPRGCDQTRSRRRPRASSICPPVTLVAGCSRTSFPAGSPLFEEALAVPLPGVEGGMEDLLLLRKRCDSSRLPQRGSASRVWMRAAPARPPRVRLVQGRRRAPRRAERARTVALVLGARGSRPSRDRGLRRRARPNSSPASRNPGA